MKKLFFAFACFGLITIYAQNPLEKITPKLQLKMQSDVQSDNYLVWVYFVDKGNNLDSYYSNPQSVVSQKSLDRRAKVLSETNLIDFTDLPVNQIYINLNGLMLSVVLPARMKLTKLLLILLLKKLMLLQLMQKELMISNLVHHILSMIIHLNLKVLIHLIMAVHLPN
jgi:hypothetical protein